MPTPEHTSASQLSMYQRCGEQFRRRYIEGEIIPPNGRMIRGTGTHKARAKNLTQKMTSKVDLPVEEIIDAARDAVVFEFGNPISLEDGETAAGAKADAIDSATRLARCDAEVFQAKITPVSVEEGIQVVVPGLGRKILGYLDTADDRGHVRDLKCMGKSPSANAADVSDQLTTYALLYKTKYGKLPIAVQIDAVVDLKSGPKATAVASTRTEEDLDMIIRRYFVAIQAIDKSVFVPCPSDHWCCSAKWCGYAMTCPYFRRGDNRPTN